MPSALTGIQRRARVALFSEALPPSPSSQDAQELKVFTWVIVAVSFLHILELPFSRGENPVCQVQGI